MKRRPPLSPEARKFFDSFTPLFVNMAKNSPLLKVRVYLYRANPKTVLRNGWLPYLRQNSNPATVVVEVEAVTRQKALNKAVTCANNGFADCRVISVTRGTGTHWDADRFPDLKNLKTETQLRDD